MKRILLKAILLISSIPMFAHPTGNMISVGENILWSYVNPIDDPNHYACIMTSEKGSEPRVFINSEFPASDFMLSNNQNDIYIIERKYLQSTREFEVRVLKTTIDTEPIVIWDWFKDEWRLGEGGFFMLSDDHIVFGKFPEVHSLKKGEQPKKYFEFSQTINRIRAVENNRILLLGDSACYLVQQDGDILKSWNNLIDSGLTNSPMSRNQIFDADYKDENLLLAYWGKRAFILVDNSGKHHNVLQQKEPLVPHWVAFGNNGMLLFSSEMIFDGSTPKPQLVLFKNKNNINLIWNKP